MKESADEDFLLQDSTNPHHQQHQLMDATKTSTVKEENGVGPALESTLETLGETSSSVDKEKVEETSPSKNADGPFVGPGSVDDVPKDAETPESSNDTDASATAKNDSLKGLEEVVHAAGEEVHPQGRSAKDTSAGAFIRKANDSTAAAAAAAGGTNNRRASVTIERKEGLLLKARKSRTRWVGLVPTPYREAVKKGDPWHQEERLSSLRSIHAAKKLPSALPVISVLYGMESGDCSPSQVADRICTVLGPELVMRTGDGANNNEKVVPTASAVLQAELAANKDDSYLKDYHSFWTQLQDPACAMLVQGMRNFCGKLKDVTQKEELAARLKAYLRGTFQSLQTHVLWKKNGADERVRRALESFLFGQCYPHLESVLWNKVSEQKDQEWLERLNDLEFVTPKDLEISCFSEDGPDLNELLKEPLEALLSIKLYFSAYDKLQRILALYHGVNAALSAALNLGRQDDPSNKKLPSADDVLPTIILTVLLAKPERLHFDLEVVEDFSPPEYLRGEAGYAFTNLYGAVHFLQDLDLEEPKSLSISPEEFRKGLESSRAKAEKRIRSSLNAPAGEAESNVGLQVLAPTLPINIPPIEIRRARERGEAVDLDWALRWTRQTNGCDSAETGQTAADQVRTDDLTERLPPGFNRSYNFLTTRPEDVKVSDLPKLLAEYRLLVRTTELLLGERAEKARAERKAKSLSAQNDLFARVRDIDPSLLPKS